MIRTSCKASIAVAVLLVACTDQNAEAQAQDGAVAAVAPAVTPAVSAAPRHSPADVQRYAEAARRAWEFVDQQYQPATGLVSPVSEYHVATTWDIGSSIGALYAANRLGFLADEEYDRRLSRALETLATVGMFRDVAFNRDYMTRQAAMAEKGKPSSTGYAWNVTDLGRLLVWLKIVAVNDPQYSDRIQKVVDRIDFDRILQDGYLYSEAKSARTRSGFWRYQEGRIGYEQYTAAGFALWDHRPEKALDMQLNAVPKEVMGQELMIDRRGYNRLTSEPYILLGLELGWSPGIRQQAERLLAAQEERYRRTDQITMVSEEAISVAPHYFFYYLVYGERGPFVIDVQRPGVEVDGPRAVSTKATFAWHALLPSDYTSLALDHIDAALTDRGWSSGVLEKSGKPSNTPNVNTSAVILESALYLQNGGRPLLNQPFNWK